MPGNNAQQNHAARPRVIGHRAVAARFDRYKRTGGYNSVINSRQFNRPLRWPGDYVYPDTYFDHQLSVAAGDEHFECYHARGETDDHTWVYVPRSKVLFTGDLIIWAVPNAGNPQKTQRYAREWAEALRTMAQLDPTVLIPGHGYPVFGRANVRRVLNDTAEYLESVYQQTLAMMNEGASLDAILHSVKPPEEFAGAPYLRAVYDEPDFIVRNIWRLEGGWYDGTPSHLKLSAESDQGREIAEMAGGVDRMIARAMEKMESRDLSLASHIIDWAVAASPDHKSAHEARVRIYDRRARESSSTMSHGIYRAAVVESAKRAGIEPPDDPRSN
jgi:alkyl sulfatase BDS1-like metallo-beta-lactamase superfamily hydrolase